MVSSIFNFSASFKETTCCSSSELSSSIGCSSILSSFISKGSPAVCSSVGILTDSSLTGSGCSSTSSSFTSTDSSAGCSSTAFSSDPSFISAGVSSTVFVPSPSPLFSTSNKSSKASMLSSSEGVVSSIISSSFSSSFSSGFPPPAGKRKVVFAIKSSAIMGFSPDPSPELLCSFASFALRSFLIVSSKIFWISEPNVINSVFWSSVLYSSISPEVGFESIASASFAISSGLLGTSKEAKSFSKGTSNTSSSSSF